MINYIKKDVTKVTSGIVAHGCNCQGVMGSGVAAALRKKWPSIFDSYARLCKPYKDTTDLLGLVHYVAVERDSEGKDQVIVANVFTQHRYGGDGRVYADINAVSEGLAHVVLTGASRNMDIYMPRIGCGLGGLNWDTQVGPLVEQLAERYPNLNIYVCDL